MFDLLYLVTYRTGEIIASVAAVFVAFSQPSVEIINPSPILVLPVPTSTELIETAVSTTTSTALAAAVAPLSSPKPAPTASVPKPKQSFAPKPATVQSILEGTTFSLGKRSDGTYWVSLRTDIGNGSGFDWGFSDSSIGGSGSVPQMKTSFLCDPQWISPPSNSPDQNPIFDVNTSYSCNISLTDAMLRIAEKKITFKTENGRLVVKSSNLGTTLRSGTDNNGFVFDNQSDSPINVNGIVVDVSFRSLNTSSPIALRFYSPDNESLISDFQIQNSPPDPLKLNFKTTQGIVVSFPFTFTVKPRSQRMLPVQILGVQPLNEVGINPEIDIVLRQVNYDNQGIKISLVSPAISWSCIPYDALTSGGNLPNESNCQ